MSYHNNNQGQYMAPNRQGDNDISRRDFLHKIGLGLASTVALKLLYNLLSHDAIKGIERDMKVKSFSPEVLKQKPMEFLYEEKRVPKSITGIHQFPPRINPSGRVIRCLRWKDIANSVEQRYGLPPNILLSMMAQESYGDPTMPNISMPTDSTQKFVTDRYDYQEKRNVERVSDGGLGLLHIQAINAKDYGLKTMPIYSKKVQDFEHGKNLLELIQTKKNITYLLGYDDRFHPLASLDMSARFICDNIREYSGKQRNYDVLEEALTTYSGRSMNTYGQEVLQYRWLINNVLHIKTPEQLKEYNQFESSLGTIQKLKNRKILTQGGNRISLQHYRDYYNKLAENYGIEEYRKLK